MKEHRYVMEQMIGRPLKSSEHVHHRNGDRSDNRPQNLELWIVQHPSGQRLDDRLHDAVALLAEYAPDALAADSSLSLRFEWLKERREAVAERRDAA
jgi:hypothetical protein